MCVGIWVYGWWGGASSPNGKFICLLLFFTGIYFWDWFIHLSPTDSTRLSGRGNPQSPESFVSTSPELRLQIHPTILFMWVLKIWIHIPMVVSQILPQWVISLVQDWKIFPFIYFNWNIEFFYIIYSHDDTPPPTLRPSLLPHPPGFTSFLSLKHKQACKIIMVIIR